VQLELLDTVLFLTTYIQTNM